MDTILTILGCLALIAFALYEVWLLLRIGGLEHNINALKRALIETNPEVARRMVSNAISNLSPETRRFMAEAVEKIIAEELEAYEEAEN